MSDSTAGARPSSRARRSSPDGADLDAELAAILRSVGDESEGLEILGRVLGALPVGVAVYDASDDDFRVVYLNAAAREGPQVLPGARVGRPLLEVFENAEEFVPIFRKLRSGRGRFTSKGYSSPVSQRVYDIDVFPVAGGSGRVSHLIGTWQDVTEQARARRRLEKLLASSEAMTRPLPLAQLADLVVREGAGLLSATSCMLQLDPPSPLPDAGDSAVREVELAGGRLVFRREAGPAFSHDEELLIREFGRWAGLALERARLLEDAQAVTRRLETAMRVALDLTGTLDPQAVVAQMLRRAIEAADADRALMLTVEGGELVVTAGQDRDELPVQPGRRLALEDDPDGVEALRTRRPVLGGPFQVVVGDRDVQAAASGIRHSARVPLVVGNRATALLLLGRRREQPFSEPDVAMLQVLAGHAALAIRNARLFAETEGVRRTLQIGVDTTLDLASVLDPDEVIARLLVRALEATGADRIALLRKEADDVVLQAGHDRDGLQVMSGAVYGEVLGDLIALAERRRAPVAFGGFTEDRLAKLPPAVRTTVARTRHSALVPLFDRDRPVAHLLLMRRQGEAFDADDISTLQLIGNAAMLAMRNAALFRDLHEAGQVKSQFLNMAAHELRTPLSVIAGYISMLADGTLGEPPAGWQAPLDVLVAKSQELGHLVDDILLAARLEGRAAAADPQRPVDVREDVREAVQRASARAELLLAQVEIQLPEEPALARVDRDHLARILDNLVNNAFTYSRGAPAVKVSVELGAEIRIAVQDRGRGIARDHQERVFHQFFRVEDPNHSYPAGTGLGLYIARTLAERQGGELRLEWSQPGQGSRFVLTLPRVEV